MREVAGTKVFVDYEHALASIPPESHPEPFLLDEWVSRAKAASHGRLDHYVYSQDAQFQLQLRTGPLVHREFHVQGGEEWYYVLQGDAIVRVSREANTRARRHSAASLLTDMRCCLFCSSPSADRRS